MMDNQEIPIGFLMELAEHPQVLNYFSQLSDAEQHDAVEGSRQMHSRGEMRAYVESSFKLR